VVDERPWLAERFDEARPRLRAVAFRMLGSTSEADDAVQEAWLKLHRAQSSEVENLGGWLTTVVARVCLDLLRSRKSRREEPFEEAADARTERPPDSELGLHDAMGAALLVVLDRLAPAERIAFVLHDLFDLSFEEIAPIVERTPEAARQLASRARRRVRSGGSLRADDEAHRQLVLAFLAASRDGDFEGLLAILAPDVILRADPVAVQVAAARRQQGAPLIAPETRGAKLVAAAFKGRAGAALPALIDGQAGAVWAVAGVVRSAFVFTFAEGKIAAIDLTMAAEPLALLEIQIDSDR
jgi:RNA polymerase sigma factor (sigma-70 family)